MDKRILFTCTCILKWYILLCNYSYDITTDIKFQITRDKEYSINVYPIYIMNLCKYLYSCIKI